MLEDSGISFQIFTKSAIPKSGWIYPIMNDDEF